MMEYLRKFERIVILSLLLMMAVAVFLSTLELGYVIIKDITTPPFLILEIDELLEIFGLFLLVLIGIELLETIKTYFVEQVVRVQVVFLVAIIAVGRKVIILDESKLSSLTFLSVGFLILALSVGYYLVRKSHEGDGM